ncbi:anthranilate synthase component II [Pseudoalteromonas sp. T1lg65]|uniref:anthranilate synthase component II n=1 Tax=Pseudoalteromonas sp. T1lg65 TaxID=2077101 RepID=UPI003F7A3647
MLLMIDNYDSFTYNLVQYFQRLGQDVLVKRNDAVSLTDIQRLNPRYLVISPGPCSPNEAGISLQVVRQFKGEIPIMGICLGHQTIAQEMGASIVRAREVMHGKTSTLYHNGMGSFSGLPSTFSVCRYHSLVIDKDTLPSALKTTAWTNTETGEIDEIMGIFSDDLALEGVQFHPEAILTEHGLSLLDNFLKRF